VNKYQNNLGDMSDLSISTPVSSVLESSFSNKSIQLSNQADLTLLVRSFLVDGIRP